MNLKNWGKTNLKNYIAIFILATLILFFDFFLNCWKVADRKWFEDFQHDDESLIIGRMVKSRQDGILSDGGLSGLVSLDSTPWRMHDKPWSERPFSYQYLAYKERLFFGTYTPYYSQIGGQGILFSLLDRAIPLVPNTKLQIFYGLTSLLSALTLALIVLWFAVEFNIFTGAFVLGSMVLSQWLVVFGRNLWWSIWAFYLPMVVLLFLLRRYKEPKTLDGVKLGILVFILVFIKCLINGYEYMTTTLIMMMVPLVYYNILYKSGVRRLLQDIALMVFGSSLAIFLSVMILCFQVGTVEGSMIKGVDHILYSLSKRTYSNPQEFTGLIAGGLKFDILSIVIKYVKGRFLNLTICIPATTGSFLSLYLLKVRYVHILFITFVASVFLYSFRNKCALLKQRKNHIPLVLTTWLSILAPLSWFIIFKQHSYFHTHMNFIVWQMPFTFFGFALCGLAIKNILLIPTHLNK
jgi:hypothetical protein